MKGVHQISNLSSSIIFSVLFSSNNNIDRIQTWNKIKITTLLFHYLSCCIPCKGFTISGCNKVGFCHSGLYSNINVPPVFPQTITSIAVSCIIENKKKLSSTPKKCSLVLCMISIIYIQTLTDDASYLNILLVVRTNRIHRCFMTFKVKKLSSRQIPNLLNFLKFQRKGKTHQANKNKFTNCFFFPLPLLTYHLHKLQHTFACLGVRMLSHSQHQYEHQSARKQSANISLPLQIMMFDIYKKMNENMPPIAGVDH